MARRLRPGGDAPGPQRVAVQGLVRVRGSRREVRGRRLAAGASAYDFREMHMRCLRDGEHLEGRVSRDEVQDHSVNVKLLPEPSAARGYQLRRLGSLPG